MKNQFEKFKSQALSVEQMKKTHGGDGCKIVGWRKFNGRTYVDLYCPSTGKTICDRPI